MKKKTPKKKLTKKKVVKRKVGRPRIPIDWDKFEFACKLMATKEEICGFLKCDEQTLTRRVKEKYKINFEGALKELSSDTKISLRRSQIKKAIDEANPTMQIWLGKQYLGQVDKVVNLDGDINDEGFRNEFFGLKKKDK